MLKLCKRPSIIQGWRQRLHLCVCSSVIDHSTIPIADRLLSGRQWMLQEAGAALTNIQTPEGHSFKVLRDDLAHPFIAGNKRRKLDALFPELLAQGILDVVTCGGTQSAHTLAVAAAAAEHGMRAHLLVRGEKPAIPTGHHLYARMFAHSVVYVKRAEYADRSKMLNDYAIALKESQGAGRVAIIPEGGAEAAALLGMLRLVDWLATSADSIPEGKEITLVVDSGTGTSAAGLALGAALLDLPWKVIGVMLAGPIEYYIQQTIELVRAFCAKEGIPDAAAVAGSVAERLQWVPRTVPRKFGNVLPGEVLQCSGIAAQYGVVLDPIWTLAAWEAALEESAVEDDNREVIMLHTGGGLGLCGVAQRYPEEF